MAYFSNGTEGMCYIESYCSRCANFRDLDDGRGPGCPVWDAHVLFIDHKKPDVQEVLDHLIPMVMVKSGRGDFKAAGQCSMFLEAK